uniref:Ig-like domain-containing protein n=2 Tax=Lepisosteus oculatus TaxID=7918 RepID=W5MZ60_LEPOC
MATRNIGEFVYLFLPDMPLTNIKDLEWKTKDLKVAKFQNGKSSLHDLYKNRTTLFSNGTLRLDQPIKNDSGTYTLDVYDEGESVFKGYIWLDVQESVSQPIVNSSCQDEELVKLMCVVEKGDNVSYKWSVNGTPLENMLTPRNDGSGILAVLKNNSEEFTCTAENNVSSETSDPFKPSCAWKETVTSGAKEEYVIVTRNHGEFVSLFIPETPSSNINDLVWKFKDIRVARLQPGNITLHNLYKHRTTVFSNGTLRLDKPLKEDSGSYILEVFNKEGQNMFKGSVRLEVQDPVSRPVIQASCQDEGTVRLVCTVQEGHNVSFQWSSNGAPLSLGTTDDGRSVLIAIKNVSEELYCTAENNISRQTSAPLKPSCFSTSTGLLTILFCLSGTLIIALLFLGILLITSKVKKWPHKEQYNVADKESKGKGECTSFPSLASTEPAIKEDIYVDMGLQNMAETSRISEQHSFSSAEIAPETKTPDQEEEYVEMSNTLNRKKRFLGENSSGFKSLQLNKDLSDQGEEKHTDAEVKTQDSSDVIYAQIHIKKTGIARQTNSSPVLSHNVIYSN